MTKYPAQERRCQVNKSIASAGRRWSKGKLAALRALNTSADKRGTDAATQRRGHQPRSDGELMAQEQNVDECAKPHVEGQVPAEVVRVLVDHDLVRIPEP